MGCSHMAVFIAGQKSRGLRRSQARMTQVCKRSQEVGLGDVFFPHSVSPLCCTEALSQLGYHEKAKRIHLSAQLD